MIFCFKYANSIYDSEIVPGKYKFQNSNLAPNPTPFILFFYFFILELNPYDYCLASVDCRVESLAFDSEEAKLISQFIYKEGQHVNKGQYLLFRKKAESKKSD